MKILRPQASMFVSVLTAFALFFSSGCCPQQACQDNLVECQAQHIFFGDKGSTLYTTVGGNLLLIDTFHQKVPQFVNQRPPTVSAKEDSSVPKETFMTARIVQDKTSTIIDLDLEVTLSDNGQFLVIKAAVTPEQVRKLSLTEEADIVVTTETGNVVKKIDIKVN